MARYPDVFVRPLTTEDGPQLPRISRTGKGPVKLRRAIVVLMSGQGQSVRDIITLLQVSPDYVPDVSTRPTSVGCAPPTELPHRALGPARIRRMVGESCRSWWRGRPVSPARRRPCPRQWPCCGRRG